VAYREVSVIEVREVLRAWLGGDGLRRVAELAGVDRKTARRYVDAEARGWGSEVQRHRKLVERLDAHISQTQAG